MRKARLERSDDGDVRVAQFSDLRQGCRVRKSSFDESASPLAAAVGDLRYVLACVAGAGPPNVRAPDVLSINPADTGKAV